MVDMPGLLSMDINEKHSCYKKTENWQGGTVVKIQCRSDFFLQFHLDISQSFKCYRSFFILQLPLALTK